VTVRSTTHDITGRLDPVDGSNRVEVHRKHSDLVPFFTKEGPQGLSIQGLEANDEGSLPYLVNLT
jgi:hypothetical protein